ncbi:sialate O-acetylesterase [Psychroserpens sp. XS_ASV72]|uniref:sialate O-acetylesterase n=1 Tax=Psychroserpens sp. XS_ASV72 TaxID=3241293 RepID=UPI0035182F64
MKQYVIFLFLFSFSVSIQSQENDPIRLFYLGGQSNMEGFGYTKDLPDSLRSNYDNVWIFEGNPVPDEAQNGGKGIWETLKPGHGTGFTSDGKTNTLSNRFGIELSFAKQLQKLYPNEKIAIIKYSRGGSSIDSLAAGGFGSWEPDFQGKSGINQYDHFLTTVNNALKTTDIDENGKKDHLIPTGIIWMQGEADAAFTEAIALRYYDNLKRLMDLMRATFRTDDLPIVIGKISDSWNSDVGKVWKYGELIQYAQEKFARTDTNATIVRSTRYYKYSDPWHYDSIGYIDLGKQFANAIYALCKQ